MRDYVVNYVEARRLNKMARARWKEQFRQLSTPNLLKILDELKTPILRDIAASVWAERAIAEVKKEDVTK